MPHLFGKKDKAAELAKLVKAEADAQKHHLKFAELSPSQRETIGPVYANTSLNITASPEMDEGAPISSADHNSPLSAISESGGSASPRRQSLAESVSRRRYSLSERGRPRLLEEHNMFADAQPSGETPSIAPHANPMDTAQLVEVHNSKAPRKPRVMNSPVRVQSVMPEHDEHVAASTPAASTELRGQDAHVDLVDSPTASESLASPQTTTPHQGHQAALSPREPQYSRSNEMTSMIEALNAGPPDDYYPAHGSYRMSHAISTEMTSIIDALESGPPNDICPREHLYLTADVPSNYLDLEIPLIGLTINMSPTTSGEIR
ncbi:hypothetical protein PLICRDRAFT_698106 [Plicaturopsis crispa FD-325 SS-3]|nr:hypothetical protein PLICRDRAFT_698106 [Plicaturopsis crispa FD-325 SS-3]